MAEFKTVTLKGETLFLQVKGGRYVIDHARAEGFKQAFDLTNDEILIIGSPDSKSKKRGSVQ